MTYNPKIYHNDTGLTVLKERDILRYLHTVRTVDYVLFNGLTIDNLSLVEMENARKSIKIKAAALPPQVWQELEGGSEFDD